MTPQDHDKAVDDACKNMFRAYGTKPIAPYLDTLIAAVEARCNARFMAESTQLSRAALKTLAEHRQKKGKQMSTMKSIKEWGDQAPQWLRDAETEDALVEITAIGYVIWYAGTWYDGTWHDGDWRGGIWHDGTWHDGTWYDGTWYDGTWRGGDWRGGTWHDGTWHDGTWHDGTWRGGTWLDGAWHGGTWRGGTWHGSTWLGGAWRGGDWLGETVLSCGQFGPSKSSGRYVVWIKTKSHEMVRVGCHVGTVEDLRNAAKAKHTGENLQWYLDACDILEHLFKRR